MTKEQLEVINQVLLSSEDKVISIQQADKLKKFCAAEEADETNDGNKGSKIFTVEYVERILSMPDETAKADDVVKVKKRCLAFDGERLNTYCRDMTDQEIEELFYQLLEKCRESGQ